jgi:hypothetical protein
MQTTIIRLVFITYLCPVIGCLPIQHRDSELVFKNEHYKLLNRNGTRIFSTMDGAFGLEEKASQSPCMWLDGPRMWSEFSTTSKYDGTKCSFQANGSLDNVKAVQTITGSKESPWVHVRVSIDPANSPHDVEGVISELYISAGSPRPIWVPNLRPHSSHVIGHHCFRSPAIVLERASIIPDINEFPDPMPFKMALDVDANKRTVRFGYLDWSSGNSRGGRFEMFDHTYYCHNPSVKLKLNKPVSFSFYILFPRGGVEETARFMWEKFGKKYMADIKPQVADWDRYAGYSYPSVLEREWNDVTADSGGIGQFSLGFHPEPDAVGFEAWHCNIRSAYGLYYFGKKMGNKDWQDRAVKIKNLAISAPMTNGIFPHRYHATKKAWHWNGHIKRILKGELKEKDCALTADSSTTALWLLRFHKYLEPDDKIVRFCTEYGERLLKTQLASGAIPSYLLLPELTPLEFLKECSQSAVSGLFLSELGDITGDERFQKGAARVGEFLEREVIPTGRYYDFETFISCSTKPADYKDTYTMVPPQNTLSMLWTAELLLRQGRIKTGRVALDTLCLYQQVWKAPFLRFHTFGGFGVQNTDAEWNDSRHALCAILLADSYKWTDSTEYFERGIAALRASFTLMVAPENKEVSPLTYNGAIRGIQKHRLLLKEPDPRAFTEKDKLPGLDICYYPLGYSSENYGHVGGDLPSGRPGFDWAEGLYLMAAAWIQERYGDVYVDVTKKRIFGINGCLAYWDERGLTVIEKLGVDRQIEISVDGSLALGLKATRKAHGRSFYSAQCRAGETIHIK